MENIITPILESLLKIEKARFKSLKEQNNFVTTLQANVIEDVIQEIENQLKELKSGNTNEVEVSDKKDNTIVEENKQTKIETNRIGSIATVIAILSCKMKQEGFYELTEDDKEYYLRPEFIIEIFKRHRLFAGITIEEINQATEMTYLHDKKFTTNKKNNERVLDGTRCPESFIDYIFNSTHIEPLRHLIKSERVCVSVTKHEIKKPITISSTSAIPKFEEFKNYYLSEKPDASAAEIAELYTKYEALNWKTRGNPMKNWTMAVRVSIRHNLVKDVQFENDMVKPSYNAFYLFYLETKPDSTQEEVKRLFDKYEAFKWKSKGKPIKDWKKSVRTFIYAIKNAKVEIIEMRKPPTYQQFESYYLEIRPNSKAIDIENCFDYFESEEPIQDWKAELRNKLSRNET